MSQTQLAVANGRRARRQPPRNSTKVSYFKGSMGLGPNQAVEVLDISESGVGLLVKSAFKKGQELEIILESLGHRRPVCIKAEVAWCVEITECKYCLGAKFLRPLNYADLQMLISR
jgi:hypothetical protein